MPQINENVWGVGMSAFYSGLNTRTGTSSISDTDYTNFAPFYYLNYGITPPSPNINTASLHKLYTLDKVNLNEPLDGTICYVGIYNSELPQLNIGVLYPGNTQEEPTFKTDNTQIQSFFLYANLEFFSYYAPTNVYVADGRVIKPSYNDGTPSKYLDWCDNGYTSNGSNVDVNAMKQFNTNLKIDPILKWGVKTFFLVIYVVYISSLDSSGQPISTRTTLNNYLNGVGHDDTWKQAHPVMCAFGQPYIRHNINGEYTTAVYNGADLLPAFTLPLTGIDGNIEHNIINYALTTNSAAYQNAPTINGCFPIYGQIAPTHYNEPNGASSSFSAPAYLGYNHGTLKKAPNNDVFWFELDLTDPDNVEYLMRGCAAYGLFFSDDYYTLAQAGRDETRWIDTRMCCGTIDENGRTNGDYTRGALNATQRQYDWSVSTESPFDPAAPPVPQNHYSDTTTFNTIGNISTLTRRYALDGTAVENLGADLWTITEDLRTLDPDEDYKNFDQEVLNGFLTTNPIDCVVSLRRFPLTLPYGSSDTIKLGKFDTNVSCYAMNKSAETYSFEGTFIAPQFGDSFLDYNPYTKFELYVPFCGTVELNPADILNRTLNVKLVVDFDTGTCTAYVLANNLCIETLNGSLAIDIPVTGTDATTVAAQIFNGIIQARQARQHGVFTNLSKAFTPSGLMSNIYNVFGSAEQIINAGNERKLAEYSISHTEAPVHVIGSASPVGSWAIDLNCRLIIYYPTSYMITYTPDNKAHWSESFISDYAQNTGFAVCQNGLVEYRRGLVIAANPLFTGVKTNSQNYPATQEELALIEQALQEGVISPGR